MILRHRCSSAPSTILCWDRPLLERLFGFKHLIEFYKREHERVYGYYVLPLLAGDRFLGRADLKADRAEGVLRIRRFTPEPKLRGNVDAKLEKAAARLARILGLERVERHLAGRQASSRGMAGRAMSWGQSPGHVATGRVATGHGSGTVPGTCLVRTLVTRLGRPRPPG